MKNIFMVSLGCPKNLVDSEVMLGQLMSSGFILVTESSEADYLIINTCGFIQSAVEEAIDEILDLVAIKARKPGCQLIVTGCLVQRYGEKLKDELPEVDLFIGTDGFQDIVTKINKLPGQELFALNEPPLFLMTANNTRQLSTPNYRAYLKLTEGCSNKCTYCMIPAIRGPLRSRTANDLVSEAKALADKNIKELTLVGQDLTAYGHDFGKVGDSLETLLPALLANTSIPWLRLLYLYPVRVTVQLLQLMADEPRLLSYLDIPLQHVSDSVLKAMKRPFGVRHIHQVVERITKILPDAAIRTTFLVGFPGETENDVEQIADFIKNYRLHNVGIFQYSNEVGCAAEFYPNQIPETEKQNRYDYLMALQKERSAAINAGYIGQELEVLVEGESAETELLLAGRSKFQAHEIDGCVYINDGQASPGDIKKVLITASHPYDLVGEIIS